MLLHGLGVEGCGQGWERGLGGGGWVADGVGRGGDSFSQA